MLDRGERVVESVQQFLPARIAIRAAKAVGVILVPAPAHQQQLAPGFLEAGPDFDPFEARRGADQR